MRGSSGPPAGGLGALLQILPAVAGKRKQEPARREGSLKIEQMYSTTQNDAMFYDRKLTITIVYKSQRLASYTARWWSSNTWTISKWNMVLIFEVSISLKKQLEKT